MDLVTAKNIKKNFSEKTLLSDVSLIIHDRDKIGLVGVNGSGKSTLLKIIAGVMDEEGGELIYSNSTRIAYLPQNPEYEPDLTIFEQLNAYLPQPEEEYKCKSILNKMHLTDTSLKMSQLSGGQRKRVAMASVVIRDSNLMILDEPTNHMDSDIIEWLEDFLDDYKGAVLMITHDRYFLERVTDHICEIENGRLISYEGNYDQYLEAKAQRLEMAMASERKRAAIYRKELRWIHWSAPARTTKAKNRIERFRKLEESKKSFENPRLDMAVIESRLGRKIIEIKNISKAYGEKKLISNFTYTLLRNDRVGIIGPNGCGKSTLLKIISEKLEADSGIIDIGETVRIGYFSQETEELDPNMRLIKFAEETAYGVQTSEGYMSASQMLERFLFPPHMHSCYVGNLSGGEKRRLALLTVLLRAPNVLLLDEPTNDLDIDTLTILEDYLDDFPGAVIAVSHDRYFLDRLAVKCFFFEEGGNIVQYTGGYSDAMNKRDALLEEHSEPSRCTHNLSSVSRSDPNKAKKLKFTYNEQREYDQIESLIADIEAQITDIDIEMANSNSDFVKLTELSEKKEELENTLLEKMERWEYLNLLAEKIAAQQG